MKTPHALFVIIIVLASMTATAGEPTHILLANDDGIEAPGLAAMAAEIAADPSYRLTIVAPARQQSVSGHSLVTRREVEVRSHDPIAGAPSWSVDGTPATVVRIGLTALLAEDPPEVIVSGINYGENDGLGSWVSGTVAAAREGAMSGVPSVAVSLQIDWSDPQPDFAAAARWAKPVIDSVRDNGLPGGVYLNVNVPKDTEATRGYRVAVMGLDESAEASYELSRADSDGVRWYVNKWRPPEDPEVGGDSHALDHGWVSIAPLGLDHTAEDMGLMLLQLPLPAAPTQSVDE
jgi:5'-nucleotidase